MKLTEIEEGVRSVVMFDDPYILPLTRPQADHVSGMVDYDLNARRRSPF